MVYSQMGTIPWRAGAENEEGRRIYRVLGGYL